VYIPESKIKQRIPEEKTKQQQKHPEEKEECERRERESIIGMERDNRTAATPDRIVTLRLITLRDMRSSMKLVQHVQRKTIISLHTHTHTHTHTYNC